VAEALASRFETQVAVTVTAGPVAEGAMVGRSHHLRGDNVLIAPEDSLYRNVPTRWFLGPGRAGRPGQGRLRPAHLRDYCAITREGRRSVLVLQGP